MFDCGGELGERGGVSGRKEERRRERWGKEKAPLKGWVGGHVDQMLAGTIRNIWGQPRASARRREGTGRGRKERTHGGGERRRR
jgi:hypothetical protein